MVQVQVWWSSLVAAERDLLGLLDVTERARVAALERPADQGRSLVAAALLRVAVGERLGVPPHEVVIDRTCAGCGEPHGRPRVLGPGDDLPEVSVSHSGLLVVVALGVGVAVGVDVQRVADLAVLAEVRDAAEPANDVPADDVPAKGVPADDEARARSWVLHEAVLKVGGASPRPVPAARLIPTPLDGYVAALATLTAEPPTDAELLVRHWPASCAPPQ